MSNTVFCSPNDKLYSIEATRSFSSTNSFETTSSLSLSDTIKPSDFSPSYHLSSYEAAYHSKPSQLNASAPHSRPLRKISSTISPILPRHPARAVRRVASFAAGLTSSLNLTSHEDDADADADETDPFAMHGEPYHPAPVRTPVLSTEAFDLSISDRSSSPESTRSLRSTRKGDIWLRSHVDLNFYYTLTARRQSRSAR
ncbi:hypothetical protein HETIRDRAFT_100706 [Heterobasidion irregulare TC 32-1]|uniref:Uncharacterized protein n=1 Tax=Heterobasidion irregulare (strain TC 32-1) TaxID=747525 RepID=W4KIX5_HETIT|nr:uncharacterized protein HETIRDRAFT_100706 [Heterobasidion irregulare TC 32-1]ETW85674.1 hypothetical protein HETIRDRAFT_100706 [Heterobasidion irregulare TC 32-1]